MKFSISQAELQNALGVVSKGAATHSTLPILAGVHLHTEDDALILQTTDLDRSIQYSAFRGDEQERDDHLRFRHVLDSHDVA